MLISFLKLNSLCYASPATVYLLTVIYLSDEDLGAEELTTAWIRPQPDVCVCIMFIRYFLNMKLNLALNIFFILILNITLTLIKILLYNDFVGK
jgi:hypothetical protein